MIDVWNLGFDQFQGAFLSTGFLALELALFQQFLDDAGSLDGKKQDLTVAQSAKDDSATGPLQHHQFEIPVDCTHDVAMYSMPASPHDRDVMHKARGVMYFDNKEQERAKTRARRHDRSQRRQEHPKIDSF